MAWIILYVTALALRLVSAWISVGFDHPNEMMRLFEPLASLRGYTAEPPWEWNLGVLSTLPVRAHLVLISMLSEIGMKDPYAQMIVFRMIYALLSLIPIWATNRMLRYAKVMEPYRLLACTFIAVWPEFVYRSVRLMDYTLEMGLLGAAWVVLLPEKKRFSEWRLAMVGVLLGSLLFLRPQTGLHFVAIAGWIFWISRRRERWQRVRVLALAYAGWIAVLGTLEWLKYPGPHTHSFLAPLLNNIRYNLIEGGAARDYGVAPWHRYFSEYFKYFGYLPAFTWIFLMTRRRANKGFIVIAVLPVMVHSLIAHKEARFIYGCLWVFVPAAFSAFAVWRPSMVRRRILAAALAGGMAISIVRVAPRFVLFASQVQDFARIGRTLKQSIAESVPPLIRIEADPVLNPGLFWLQYRGPICFEHKCTVEQLVERPQWLIQIKDGHFQIRRLERMSSSYSSSVEISPAS